MDSHKHEELSDELLEREIEAMLSVDPSPQFRARVRARVASENVREGWVFPWRAGWAAAAIVAIAALAVFRSPTTPPPEQSAIMSPRAIVAPESVPETVAAEAAATRGVAAMAPVGKPHPAAAAKRPEVLISQDDAAALRRLVTAMSARRVEPAMLPDLSAWEEPLPALGEIVLDPIVLSPLVRLDGEEGVPQ